MRGFALYFLQISLWVVALMSGILSLFRELLLIYRSEQVQQRSLFWNCMIISFIISAAILWTLEHNKVAGKQDEIVKLQEQLKKISLPDFTVSIQAPIAHAWAGKEKQDSIVTFIATIENQGAQSSAKNFSVAIKMKNGDLISTTLVTPSQRSTLFDNNGNKIWELTFSDWLPKKSAEHPVAMNGEVQGFIMARVKGVSADSFTKDASIVLLKLSDVKNREYTAEAPLSGEAQRLETLEGIQPK